MILGRKAGTDRGTATDSQSSLFLRSLGGPLRGFSRPNAAIRLPSSPSIPEPASFILGLRIAEARVPYLVKAGDRRRRAAITVRRSVYALHGMERVSTPSSSEIRTVELTCGREAGAVSLGYTPWHFLYFFPLPHGQGSLRPTFSSLRWTVWVATGSSPRLSVSFGCGRETTGGGGAACSPSLRTA